MKHLKFIAMWFFGATVVLTSCKKDKEDDTDDTVTPPVETPGTVVVTSNITANTTY